MSGHSPNLAVVELPREFDLQGRVALITGAGSAEGIGFATANLLGRLGARVAVTATTDRIHGRVEELEKQGLEAFGAVADLTVEGQVLGLIESASKTLGPPSILVNNAGMTSLSDPELRLDHAGESGDVGATSMEHWHRSLRRNLDTAFLTTRTVLPGMVRAGWGRVVMVASVTGPVMAMRAEASYATAKAGMVGLARSVALDYARRGITANAVAPGWIATGSQMAAETVQGDAVPAGRSGTPGEIASAIAFLCSLGAAYLNGQCIVVDGGNAIAEERVAPGPAVG